jgi:hypothetical protein
MSPLGCCASELARGHDLEDKGRRDAPRIWARSGTEQPFNAVVGVSMLKKGNSQKQLSACNQVG